MFQNTHILEYNWGDFTVCKDLEDEIIKDLSTGQHENVIKVFCLDLCDETFLDVSKAMAKSCLSHILNKYPDFVEDSEIPTFIKENYEYYCDEVDRHNNEIDPEAHVEAVYQEEKHMQSRNTY